MGKQCVCVFVIEIYGYGYGVGVIWICLIVEKVQEKRGRRKFYVWSFFSVMYLLRKQEYLTKLGPVQLFGLVILDSIFYWETRT